jgi:uncharacterized C2H2 Zn-finger protein
MPVEIVNYRCAHCDKLYKNQSFLIMHQRLRHANVADVAWWTKVENTSEQRKVQSRKSSKPQTDYCAGELTERLKKPQTEHEPGQMSDEKQKDGVEKIQLNVEHAVDLGTGNQSQSNSEIVSTTMKRKKRRFPCEHCHQSYTKKSNLRRHIERVHVNMANSVTIEQYIFGATSTMECELIKVAAELPQVEDQDDKNPELNLDEVDEHSPNDEADFESELEQRPPMTVDLGGVQMFNCDLCEMTYRQRFSLTRHRKKAHNMISQLVNTAERGKGSVLLGANS